MHSEYGRASASCLQHRLARLFTRLYSNTINVP